MTKLHKDIGQILTEQLQNLIGSDHKVTMTRERPWASVTFSGTRHSVAIASPDMIDQALRDLLNEKLNAHEFDLAGHFVADLLIHGETDASGRLTLDILTIIDPLASPAGKSGYR